MAKETLVTEKLRSLGVEPLEKSCIVVQYAAPNLSEKVARFLIKVEPHYVLQLCTEDLVLAPLRWTGKVKEVEPLKLPVETIKSVDIQEEGFNYRISIILEDGAIDLVAQQKELALLRNSGALSVENFWGTKSWHVNNLDGTLEKLRKLVKN
ncbi:hypothetical protein NRIC_07440 [Enterococcus florum]|uniref:Uncharacterized protein n=1 Tax=Enterococcus florum TaxID=2480627 RepID=A0A4P5PHF8_9ENTE|nr:hypothetical protein [Enterococcus florum]GCF92853.1 hypothetical protein NRIC_07440 [Enterococcus florum]